MKKPVFVGAATAIVTPIFENTVDYKCLAEQIEFQITNQIDAIVVCGTTGEASVLTDEEHQDCIEFAVKQAAGRVPVIAGTGSNDTVYAAELSRYAEKAGADALLCVTPYYNKTTQKGLVKHFNYIADSVNIPVILYNVPSRTGMSITSDTYKELSKHPMINGVKEASGNISLVMNTAYACGDELNIWSGNDDNTVSFLALGAKGVISTTGNVIPRQMHDICALFFSGKTEEACKLQIKYAELFDRMFIETNPIPVKTAMNMLGMKAGELRLPLCEMSGENRAKLKAALIGAGLDAV